MSTSAKTGKMSDGLIATCIVRFADLVAQATLFILDGTKRTAEMIGCLLNALQLFKENRLEFVLSKEDCEHSILIFLRFLQPGAQFIWNPQSGWAQAFDLNSSRVKWSVSKTPIFIPTGREIFLHYETREEFQAFVFGLAAISGLSVEVSIDGHPEAYGLRFTK